MRRIQLLTEAATAVCATLGVGHDRLDAVVLALDSALPAFLEDRRTAKRATRNPENPTLRCASCAHEQLVPSLAAASGWVFEDNRWFCPKCFG